MFKIGKLYVCLLADTEDNHPNYVPGWEKYGTNYDVKDVIPRFDWVKYWDVLIELFNKYNFPITWFLRVDLCIKDKALKRFKPYLKKLKKHEIGIHIHTLEWDKKIWRQSLDPKNQKKIISSSIKLFKQNIGYIPNSSRMGWNTMSNDILEELEKNNIKYDCSALPDNYSEGFFKKRDNIIDWRNSPKSIYHPLNNNYKAVGNMNISIIPISSIGKKNIVYNNFFVNLYNKCPSFLSVYLIKYAKKIINNFDLSPHNTFVISPSWKIKNSISIIDEYIKTVKSTKEDTILIGFFHPCDIFDPKNNCLNHSFINKIEKVILYLKNNYEKIIPLTISDAANRVGHK